MHSHLERVSRSLLEEHPEVVRRFVGRNAGIYALYRKSKLYYVGLASRLSARLRHHVRDRHGLSWDRFSIYLTIKDQHLREIESLLLQIAKPTGNRAGGKPAGSQNMRRWIERAIREKRKQEIADLFDRSGRQSGSSRKKLKLDDELELVRLLPQGARLRGSYKGQEFKAIAKPDGRVRFNGTYYKSLSTAASAAIKRPSNGWWFWKVERGRGNWQRLTKIRKAGTPVFTN